MTVSEEFMASMTNRTRTQLTLALAATLAAAVVVVVSATMVVLIAGQQRASQAPSVPIDADDIGGTVTGPNGPEAGVWVIAETRTLPTRLIKTVVTDDRGRFLVPDLPKADYDVWVRG